MEGLIPVVNTIVLAIAFIAFMVGLCLMPWQILLMLLIGGLIASRRLMVLSSPQTSHSPQASPADTAPTSANSVHLPSEAAIVESGHPADSVTAAPTLGNSAEGMLIYRGARYKPPTVSTDAIADHTTELSGKYRGSIWTGKR